MENFRPLVNIEHLHERVHESSLGFSERLPRPKTPARRLELEYSDNFWPMNGHLLY